MYGKRRLFILICMFISLFLAALDQTIITTSLTKIISYFQQPQYYSLIMVSYLLSSVIFLPIFGRLCDIISLKILIIIANIIFILGSYLCFLSNHIYEFIFFRFVQGIGGGGIFAITFSTIGILYTPRERGKIQGWISMVFGFSSIIGPILGGYITYQFSWKWIFLINVMLGMIVVLLLIFYMPLITPISNQKFDFIGAILLFIWTFALVLFLSGINIFKYDKITYFVISIIGILLYYKHEQYVSSPLFDINLFKNDTFVKCSIATFFLGATFMGILTFMPIYLHVVYNLNTIQIGFILTFLTIAIVISSTMAGKFASELGKYKYILVLSNVIIIINLLILTVFIRFAIIKLNLLILLLIFLGFGLGPILPLYILAVQNNVVYQRMGTATSSIQFFRQIGSTMGVAILGYIYTFYTKLFQNNFHELFSILILICLIFTLAGFIVTIFLENISLNEKHKVE